MHTISKSISTGAFLLLWILSGWGINGFEPVPALRTSGTQTPTATPQPVGPYDLIQLVNQIRTGNELRALKVNSILMGTAQTTANIMAGNEMMGHIGNVSVRVMDAGYGNGQIAWATENFAVTTGADAAGLLDIWADAEHMIPMVGPNYTDIGAGVATSPSGMIYLVVHAAYVSLGTSRTQLTALVQTPGVDEVLPTEGADQVSQYIYAVKVATPGRDGRIIHLVQQGQSLWSIAIAYNTHIRDICLLNGISVEHPVVYSGDQLWIPTTTKAPVVNTGSTGGTAPASSPGSAETEGRFGTNEAGRFFESQVPDRETQLAIPTATSRPPSLVAEDRFHSRVAYSIAGIIGLGVICVLFGWFQRKRS
jgi:hypothetical protein